MTRRMQVSIAVTVVLLLVLPYAPSLLNGTGTPMLIGETHPDPLVKNDSDVYEGCWHFWWTSRAVSMGTDPRQCTMVFPPGGASMAYQHIGWLDTFFFTLIGVGEEHPVASYDIALLTGTLLTALFGMLLARSWGLGPAAALLTALMMAWMPARTARVVQHYQLADCWTLVAALWLCRSWLNRGGRARYAGFAVAAAAASLQSPFLGMFVLLGLPATVWASRSSWRRGAVLSAGALAGTAVGLLMVVTAPGNPGSPAMDPSESFYWAAEPQSLLLPSPFGVPAVLAGMPHRMSWMSNTSEGVIGPGLLVVMLALLAAFRYGRWRTVMVAMAFYVLCLGPELRVLSRHTGIPLPFALFRHLPVLEGIRAPSRFALVGGVFTALGAGHALDRLGKGWFRVAAVLVALELFVPLLPMLPAEVPPEVMGFSEDSRVLEVPVEEGVRRYSLFQTGGAYTRMYCFLARPPEGVNPEEIVDPFEEATVMVYHRWLFEDEQRLELDVLLSPYFPGSDLEDSVWVAYPPEGTGP